MQIMYENADNGDDRNFVDIDKKRTIVTWIENLIF